MRSLSGRVLWLVLVGVLLMSVIGLSAIKTFINRTGSMVVGITVEFSKNVTITRYNPVFPDQSPSGCSDQFTFDDGELRNFGWFSITWVPSLVKVTNYEWIKKAQLTQKPQAAPATEEEFKLLDPNTPPILYGDDYPGPNEPLYQPKPDQQIWLTDLGSMVTSTTTIRSRSTMPPGLTNRRSRR